MNSDDKKILILGTSRGGTTLISAALGSHPDLAILDEDMGQAINHITGLKIPGNKLCVPNQIDFDRRWNPLWTIGLSNGFFRKSLFMSKMPKGRLSIQDYQDFGDIHHVCILRHPAGVLRSIQKRENRSMDVATYRWRRCLEVFKILKDHPDYKACFISFEGLVDAPEGKLKIVSDFLGVPFDAAMLNGPQANARYKTDQGFQASKTQYEDAEEIWSHFAEGTKELYEEVLGVCV